jgi:large subunit ribosomal protein L18
MKKKIYLQQKRRYLKKIIGTSAKPRLSVFRSHQHIYAQLIDDQTSHTLASSSTLEKDLILTNSSATQSSAFIIGENLALKALKKNITYCVFDRGNRPYHGRIKNVAEGARKQGLIF